MRRTVLCVLQVAEALKSFEEFMAQSSITNPESVADVLRNMVDDQKRVHQKRTELLETIK